MSARLQTRDGRQAMLEGVTASGDLRGLLLELSVEQRFRNTGDTNLEVVYRFPLPWGAVLLGLDVILNGRHLTGSVVERRAAEARYEEALSEGHSAIMLEQNGDGSYSLNLGNLLAGETCHITLRYAQVLHFEQGGLRLLIPTVIAPRYGDPVREGGLAPHQTPRFDLRADYPFAIQLRLHGALARARVASPSHPIAVGRDDRDGTEVLALSLARQGALDRDFVLVVDQLARQSLAVMAWDRLADPGTAQVVVLTSILPSLPARPRGQALKVLVDCSGSMAGDSIAAARRALQAVLDQLAPGDRFSLSRFGSTVEHRSRALWSLTETTRLSAQRWVGGLQANLGGTEMQTALVSTCALPHDGDTDLLLITDGQIEGVDPLIETARGSGHRVFVVGIGASPAEGHLRRLAEATGGACDFVAPGEAVEPGVLRMFARLHSPRLTGLRWVWPQGEAPLWESVPPAAVFDGDTVNGFARFREAPTGPIRLLGIPAGAAAAIEVGSSEPGAAPDPEPGDALARLAAMDRYRTLTAGEAGAALDQEAVALALAYQLVTERTNVLLVQVRAEGERPAEMPQMHQVAQMLPAGWGGVGSLRTRAPVPADAPPPSTGIRDSRSAPDPSGGPATLNQDFYGYLADDSTPPAPPFQGKQRVARSPVATGGPGKATGTPLALSNWLRRTPVRRWPGTYAGLQALGLDPEVLDWLECVIAAHPSGPWQEAQVVAAFLYCMASDDLHAALAGPGGLGTTLASATRRLRALLAGRPPDRIGPLTDPELAALILPALAGLSADRWPEALRHPSA